QLQRPAVVELVDRLDRALAGGRHADQRRTVVLGEGEGQNFSPRSGVRPDEHDEREAVPSIVLRRVEVHLGSVAMLHGDDASPRRQEPLGHPDGRLDEPARAVPQIERERGHALRGQTLQLGLHVLDRGLGKGVDPQVTDVLPQHPSLDAAVRDPVAGDLDGPLLGVALDEQLDLAALFTADALDDLAQIQIAHALPVDAQNAIARAEIGAGGRAVRKAVANHGYIGDAPGRSPQPEDLPLSPDVELLELRGAQEDVDGMTFELDQPPHDALYGTGPQNVLGQGAVHVVLADDGYDLVERP